MTETPDTNLETRLKIWERDCQQWQKMFEMLAYDADVLRAITPFAQELQSLPDGTEGLSRAIQLRKKIRESVLRFC